SYDITKARATKLHAWKSQNGPIQELSDIFNVEGFGLKAATKFFGSLLEASNRRTKGASGTQQKLKTPLTTPFISPTIDEEQRLRIGSSVGIRIGVTSVSWARFELGNSESPCHLTHWHHYELNDKKLHLVELARRCLYLVHQIQHADCYVMERPQMAQAGSNPGSIDQQNINIQKAQVSAIISYALMFRAGVDKINTNNLFFMRRFLTARLFNHLVGAERVSSEDTLWAMMRNNENSSTETPPNKFLHTEVQFPEKLCKMFEQHQRYQRELLGQAFLLNLAFARLVIFQDPKAISSISRFAKGSPQTESS
ncbi:hypothetical protein KR074_002879, partial [Drosophila pseudoananassae]